MKIMRKVLCLLLTLSLGGSIGAACADADVQEELEKEISAFEITAIQRELAAENEGGYTVLDAGRGNPNWINTQARYAFSRFMEYAVGECERTMNEEGMAGQAEKEGISERFAAAMDAENETDAFLLDSIEYCVSTLGLDREDLLKELVDAIIGDYYPSPSRCLTNTEVILNAYLQSTLYNGADLAGETGVFPTEGGSAAIVYAFEALSHNKLLKPGDRIALSTPIFTPYLEIPSLKGYDLVAVDVTSSEDYNWDIDPAEIEKLADPSIKAFFLVNPSNPASHALSPSTLEKLVQAVEKNPDLIILTDDVYGTFVEDFQTVYSVLPYNTILVYSFSKLYGATGWRVGMIAINDENVCDYLLGKLPEDDKEYLNEEYANVTDDAESLQFLDRIVADSRAVSLYHTSGLSTPSQVFMDLLSLSHLVYGDQDPYIRHANETVHSRYLALMNALGLEPDDAVSNAKYYALINVVHLAADRYGEEFAGWLGEEKTEIEFLNDLASRKGVVLMYGPGFRAPYGTVRISLANLSAEDYTELGERLFKLLDEYYEESGIALKEAA